MLNAKKQMVAKMRKCSTFTFQDSGRGPFTSVGKPIEIQKLAQRLLTETGAETLTQLMPHYLYKKIQGVVLHKSDIMR